MKCTTVQELLADYVEGRLGDDVGQQVAGHLPECEECAREAQKWHEISLLLHSAPAPRVSEQFIRQTVQAARAARAARAALAPHGGSRATRPVRKPSRSQRQPFFQSETLRNAAAAIAAALILMLVSDALLGGAGSLLAGHSTVPSGVAAMTGDAVSGVFIRLGGLLDSAFGFLMRLSDLVMQLR